MLIPKIENDLGFIMLRIQIRKRLDNDLQFIKKFECMHVVLLKSNSFIFLAVWLKNTLSFLAQTNAFETELLCAIIFYWLRTSNSVISNFLLVRANFCFSGPKQTLVNLYSVAASLLALKPEHCKVMNFLYIC